MARPPGLWDPARQALRATAVVTLCLLGACSPSGTGLAPRTDTGWTDVDPTDAATDTGDVHGDADTDRDTLGDAGGDTQRDTSGDASPDVLDVEVVGPDEPLFERVGPGRWDETAVRQVLQVFALGASATDARIRAWADAPPEDAIVEILTFDAVNPALTPDSPIGDAATLRELAAFYASDAPNNPVAAHYREQHYAQHWAGLSATWRAAMTRFGANPVLHRLGLVETNDHMAVNSLVVNNWQLFAYYDAIIGGLASGAPYQDVVAAAAASAAVAEQYNHKENVWVNGEFAGNENFAREFHQLFFGILGNYDPEAHELVTIRNTARMLTDMEVPHVPATLEEPEHYGDTVVFGTELHHVEPLEILGVDIAGATALEKIRAAADVAIRHPESRRNLPVILIRLLADDVVDDEEATAIRTGWAAMGDDPDLLRFLRDYAISTTFHSPDRVTYWSSAERNTIASNANLLTLTEFTRRYYDTAAQVQREGVFLFRPLRDVFGAQTGLDVVSSGDVFREAYNLSIDRAIVYLRSSDTGWLRDWGAVVPRSNGAGWRVDEVAEWLWERVLADGLDHFGTLERAHVHAMLGAGIDLAVAVDRRDPMRVITTSDIEADPDLQATVDALGREPMNFDDPDPLVREEANRRMGMAMNFIVSTPWAFAQEGRR